MGLALGAGNTGLTLEMQLKNTAGTNVGSAVTTGFVEFGATGNYLFHYASWPDGHRGAAVFQISGGGAVKACVAINPEEAENTEVKTSTRLAPTTAGRTLDVTTGGEAGIDWANIGAPTTAVNLSATQISTVNGNVGGSVLGSVVGNVSGTVASVVGNVGGNVVGSVGSMASGGIAAASFAAGAIDAAAIATDAIGSSELAASAVTEIQTGLATSASIVTLQADTDDIQTRLPAALVGGRMDSSVGARAADQAPLQPTVAGRTLDVAATGEAGLDFDNIKDATGPHPLTNITVPVTTTVTNDVGITQAAADKAWLSATRTLTSFGTLVADTTTAVWAAGTRTLTSFGTLVADVATAVWAAGTRTLTSFGTLVQNVVNGVWDEPRSGHLQLGSFGIVEQAVRDGQALAGTSTTLTLDAGASAVNDFYTNDVIFLKVGTGAGQVNIISDYDGATKVATMLAPWVVTPDSTSCFVILPLALIQGASTLTAAAIWSYVTRTLTMSAAQIAALLDGTTMTITRGDTISIPVTGLGNITSRTKLYFTVKDALPDADLDAIIQIEETAGLTRLNGAVGTAGQGSLTVTNATLGNVTIALVPAASAALLAPQNYRYDIQMIAGTAVTTLTTGVFTVLPDVTQAIT